MSLEYEHTYRGVPIFRTICKGPAKDEEKEVYVTFVGKECFVDANYANILTLIHAFKAGEGS